jgi:hypothetical protein
MSNNKSDQSSSVADISALYTSPSMPNISLGRPPSNSVINILVQLNIYKYNLTIIIN